MINEKDEEKNSSMSGLPTAKDLRSNSRASHNSGNIAQHKIEEKF